MYRLIYIQLPYNRYSYNSNHNRDITEILLKVAFNNITQTPHLFVGAISPENYWIDGSDSLAEGEWRWMMQEGNSQPITGYT